MVAGVPYEVRDVEKRDKRHANDSTKWLVLSPLGEHAGGELTVHSSQAESVGEGLAAAWRGADAGRRAALVQHEVRPEVGRDAQEGLKEASVHHEQPRRLGDHRRARARLRRPQRELAEPRPL